MFPPVEIHKTKATDWFRLLSSDKSKIPSAGFAMNTDNSFKGRFSRFIRGNFFIPDPRRGWNRYAFRKACEIIESQKIDRIITTSPPHSTQLIGLRLRKKYPAIRWIADLRDPWTDIYYYKKFYPTPVSRMIDSAYEKRVLQSADLITTVGNSLKALLGTKVPGIEEKIHVISNGFDEDDFSGIIAEQPDVFTIGYIGSLSGIYPINGFLDALRTVASKGIKYRLSFTGSVPAEIKDKLIRGAGVPISASPLSPVIRLPCLICSAPAYCYLLSLTMKVHEVLSQGKCSSILLQASQLFAWLLPMAMLQRYCVKPGMEGHLTTTMQQG